ncbi:MAG: DUF4097 family beta strand repeat-containing protein [Longimicrobiales bacterium]
MKIRKTTTTGALILAVLGTMLAGPARVDAQETWDWRAQVAPGRSIEVKGVNGGITANLAAGDEVRVTARKTGRRSDPAEVEIVVVEHDAGVTICTVYPSPSGRRPNECRPGSGGRNETRNNDVSVQFTVSVPPGVEFIGQTVNGNVRATSLESDVTARTVNGSVTATTTGIARASTVNGSIDVALGRSDWSGELEYETVNGAITVALSGEVNTEVSATTVNGGISTDFPLTIRGRFGPKRINGTIGSGGRTLSLSTVNGSLTLRRR